MEQTRQFRERPPRLQSYFQSHPLFFVTFNTWKGQRLLASDTSHKAFLHYCNYGIDAGKVEVGQYVIMPDHVHLFVRGDMSFDSGLWIRGLKRAISKVVPARSMVDCKLWQEGFFDHVLRNDESYEEKWNYVRQNPLRAKLVKEIDEWPFAGELVGIEK